MRKTRNALLGILTMMSGAILAVPTEAAERYISGVYVYKAGPERWFSYPYGAPISGGRSARSAIPTSTPTTGVITPPDITTTTGIGNVAARPTGSR
jgi:hypothetical protein